MFRELFQMYLGLWTPTTANPNYSFSYSPNPLFHTFSSSSHQYLLPSFFFSPCVLFHWEIGVIREEYPEIPWPPAQSPASICAYSLPSFLGMKHTKLCISAACALDPIPSPLLKDSESATFPSLLHHHSHLLYWLIRIRINCYHFGGSSSQRSSWILAVAS